MQVLRRTVIHATVLATAFATLLVPLAGPAGAAKPANTWSTCIAITGIAAPTNARACGSTLELYLADLPASEPVWVDASGGGQVARGSTDSYGSLVVRNLDPGSYNLRFDVHSGLQASGSVTVMDAVGSPTVNSTTPVAANLYSSQKLKAGLNYITTRDGTKIAATVRLPFGQKSISGTYPTVIEYSGYNTAAPKSLADSLLCPVLKNCGSYPSGGDPLLPSSSTVVGAVVAPVMGFAVVSVQLRGSACSGGAFDLFGYPSDYDGYDVVETVAAQSWVKGNKVGMVGISYSGISQLEVAGTQPPHLAAITPLSPTDDLFSTGYPGGIYNDGFAKGWIQERINDAAPTKAADGADLSAKATATNPDTYSGGQGWTRYQIADEMAKSWKDGSGGSSTCLANQALHNQAQSLATLVGPDLQRDPALFDRRSPTVWASKITVPTYLVGSLQDEQTGPQWTNLIGAFPDSNKDLYVTMDNGTHIDSMGPLTLSRWIEFLQVFVAGQAPSGPGGLGTVFAGIFIPQLIGGPATTLPAPRHGKGGNGDLPLSNFRATTPRVRVLFDNGGGSMAAGSMNPTGEVNSTSWPLPDKLAADASWTLFGPKSGSGNEGSMGDASRCTSPQPNFCGGQGGAGGRGGAAAFAPTPRTGNDKITLPGIDDKNGCSPGNAFATQPCYHWTAVPNGGGVAFISDPLTSDLVVAGDAAVKLQVASTATDADLQATVSEVRSEKLKVNGGAKQTVETEEYVGSGFLRASMRKLKAESSDQHPMPSYLASDQALLTPGTPVSVSVPLGTIAHLFRKGTRIRIVVSAPGGDRPSWTFDTLANAGSDRTTLSGLGDVSTAAFSFRYLKNPAKKLKTPSGKIGDTKSALSYKSPACSALKDSRYLYGSLRGEPCRLYQPLVAPPS